MTYKALTLATLAALSLNTAARAEDKEKPAPDARTQVKIEESDRKPALPVGTVVPDFQLKDSEGKDVDLNAYRGEGILVVTFLSGKCPVSNALHPSIATASKTYGEKGVKFLGIMSNSTEKTVEVAASVRKQGIEFPLLDDPGNKVADLFDAIGTPHMFIIDKTGKLSYSGAFCDNWKEMDKAKRWMFKEALDAVLAGKAPAEPEPDDFVGCSIKRVKTTG